MSQQQIQLEWDKETIVGRYTNMMQVAHTREEFVLDFMNVLPPKAILVSRVLTSPGHLKRIVKALQENLERYEKSFGQIHEAEQPSHNEFGFADK